METPKKILKEWFENFKKPIQEQFSAWIDSYWHKSEKIPAASIQNLDTLLADFSTKTELENLTINVMNLQSQVNNLPKPSEYNVTVVKNNKFQFLKDGNLIQEIDLTKYVNKNDLPQIEKGEIIDVSLVLTKSDTSTIIISLADLKIKPEKRGIQFSEPISLAANTPTKLELPINVYLKGVEVTGVANVSVGTSDTTVDDLGEVDSNETPILEVGLIKVSEVWFLSDANCTIEPIIYIK